MNEVTQPEGHLKPRKKPLSKQVATVAGHIVSQKGVVSVIDVLLAISWLSQKNLDAWKTGKIPYLEAVITANLKKISSTMKEFIAWGEHSKLKASTTVYKHKNVKLRFSKSGSNTIEAAYCTHYVLLKWKSVQDNFKLDS